MQARDIANMSGEEFGRMIENDIETLESELFHGFSDDESANFVRQNHVLGGSNCGEHEDSHKYQFSKEALARRSELFKYARSTLV